MALKSVQKAKKGMQSAAQPTKKPVAKLTIAKSAKPAAADKKSVALKPVTFKEPLKKTELIKTLIERSGVNKKEVTAVLDCLTDVIEGHIKPKGAGKFVLPGLLAIHLIKKPATKARKGISPFSGEEIMFKAKPARKVVKIKPLKKLKEMTESV